MEIIAVLIAIAVIAFGGPGFKKSLKESPTVAAFKHAPQRFGLPRIIGFGVVAAIALYYVVK